MPLAAAAAASGMDRVLKRLLLPPPPPRAPPLADAPAPLRAVAGSWAEVAAALAGVSCLLRLGGDGPGDGRRVSTSPAELLRQWCRAGGRLDGVAGCVARLLAARRRAVARRSLARRGGWRVEAAGSDAAGDAAGGSEVDVWPASRFGGRTPLMLCAQLGMSAAVRREPKFKPQALTPTVARTLLLPPLSLPPLLTPLPTSCQVRRLLRSTAAEPPPSRMLDTPLAAADDPSW